MQLTIDLPPKLEPMTITGPGERNLKILRETLGVTLTSRGGRLKLSGDTGSVGLAAGVIEKLRDAAEGGKPLGRAQLLDEITAAASRSEQEQARARRMVEAGVEAGIQATAGGPGSGNGAAKAGDFASPADLAATWSTRGMDVYLPGKRIRPMTDGQRAYLQAIANHDLTFCTGPAGTGKTYLAVAAAASLLKHGHVRKLVLVRPAVEAGEKLGFLPGSMQEKVNPYLRPLLDALNDMMEYEHLQRFMSVDLIEIIPLAFMRGRTLNDAAVILDEAQNATRSQMLMFLTRLGHGSKMVITGDASQTDLDDARDSGLVDAVRRLGRVRGVASTTLDGRDIVRHQLVQRIVEAYGDSA